MIILPKIVKGFGEFVKIRRGSRASGGSNSHTVKPNQMFNRKASTVWSRKYAQKNAIRADRGGLVKRRTPPTGAGR